jgi:hypothetical protein
MYILLFNVLQLPSHAAISRIDSIFRRRLDSFDAAVMIIAEKVEPYVHFNDLKRAKLAAMLNMANISMTPEQYVISAWVKGAPLLILGLLLLFKSVFAGLCFFAGGIFVIVYYRTQISRSSKQRQFYLEADLPNLISHILNSMSYHQPLYNVLFQYLPIAGKTMRHELDILLGDMRTGNHDVAFNRFRERTQSNLITRFVNGLISLDHGENMYDYFKSMSVELKGWSRTQLGILAAKRPNELLLTDFLLYLGIIVFLTIAIFTYILYSITQFV